MREKLTLNTLTKEFAHILGHLVKAEFSEPASPSDRIHQIHVDAAILPEHQFKSLDDVSEEVLAPCAYALARILKDRKAVKTFELNIPGNCECSIQRYDGLSVRGLVQRDVVAHGEVEGTELRVDIFRFDVLFETAE